MVQDKIDNIINKAQNPSPTIMQQVMVEDIAGGMQELLDETIDLNKHTGTKYTFDTMAQAQSSSWLVAEDVVEVLGYYTKGDGAGHKRIVSATDDGSGITVGGLWANYINIGITNVKHFGAKGDGVTDDTASIKKALISTSLFLPKGIYLVSEPIYTPTDFEIRGEEEYSTVIRSSSSEETIITGIGYTHIENISIYGIPATGRMYNVGTKGIVSRGNTTMTNVNIRYFATHFYWASHTYPLPYDGTGGGFYNKMINCSFIYGDTLFDNIYGNNFSFWGCKVAMCNTFVMLKAGTGNFTFDSGAIESWTGAAIRQSDGADCNVSILNTYFENRPSTYTNTLIGLDVFGNAFIVSMSEGTLVFENNNIQTIGIKRGINTQPSGGRPISIFGTGNIWLVPEGSNNDLEYAYVSGNGVEVVCLTDTYDEIFMQGATKTYPKKFAYINNDVKKLKGYDAITKIDLVKNFTGIQLENGWVNTNEYGYPTISCKVENGALYMRGQINGSSATNGVCAYLPASVLAQLNFQSGFIVVPTVQTDGVSRFVRIIKSNGSIIVSGLLASIINFQPIGISINS